ncbi:MAG: FecR family protein [Sandaracinaceae bacterium]
MSAPDDDTKDVLRSPSELRRYVRAPTDEAAIARMWSRVREGRGDGRGRGWAIGLAVGAAVAAAIALWVGLADAPDTLRAAEGDALPAEWIADDAPRTVALDDGSEVDLAPETTLRTIDNGPERFVTLLERGRAHFSVEPGGPRTWVVESGLATVEVVGTAFSVERRAADVEVRVERGVVVVRGERVPDRGRRLTRGQSLVVRAETVASRDDGVAIDTEPARHEHADEASDVDAPSEPLIDEPTSVEPPAPTDAPAPRPRHPPATPEPIALLAPAPIEAAEPEPSVAPEVTLEDDDRDAVRERLDDLLARARAARRRGDVELASDLLELASHESDPRAARYAFDLGRMEMDQLQRPWRARRAFRRALELGGLPSELEREARERLARLGAD